MSDFTTDTDEIVHQIRNLERKAEGLLQDKQDGEDISLDRADVKEEFEEVQEEFRNVLKLLHGAAKDSFKEEYGGKLTRIKQLISKL